MAKIYGLALTHGKIYFEEGVGVLPDLRHQSFDVNRFLLTHEIYGNESDKEVRITYVESCAFLYSKPSVDWAMLVIGFLTA